MRYLRAATKQTGASAVEAAAAKDSAHGASGDQLASEANEAAADGSGLDAPGEPLALGSGAAAAVAATKDLESSMLGKAAQKQRS
jgi:hypothetical protein